MITIELKKKLSVLALLNLNFLCQQRLNRNNELYLQEHRTCAIITRGLYTFYPLFEVHLCSMTFGFMYGQYSRAVSNQEGVLVARIWFILSY